jgi:hypothetical protein
MTRITMIDLLTISFVLVDDWCQSEGIKLLKGKPGAKAEFTDSEVLRFAGTRIYSLSQRNAIPWLC